MYHNSFPGCTTAVSQQVLQQSSSMNYDSPPACTYNCQFPIIYYSSLLTCTTAVSQHVLQQSSSLYYNSLQTPSMYYTCMYYTQPPGVVQQSPNMYYNNLQTPSMYCTCMYYTQSPGVLQQSPNMFYNSLLACTTPNSSFLTYTTTVCTTHSLQA